MFFSYRQVLILDSMTGMHGFKRLILLIIVLLCLILSGCSNESQRIRSVVLNDGSMLDGEILEPKLKRALQKIGYDTAKRTGIDVIFYVFRCEMPNSTPFFKVQKYSEKYFNSTEQPTLFLGICPDLRLITPRYSPDIHVKAFGEGLSHGTLIIKIQQKSLSKSIFNSTIIPITTDYLNLIPDNFANYYYDPSDPLGLLNVFLADFSVDQSDFSYTWRAARFLQFVNFLLPDNASALFVLLTLFGVGFILASIAQIILAIVLLIISGILGNIFKKAAIWIDQQAKIIFNLLSFFYVKFFVLTIISFVTSGLTEHEWLLNDIIGPGAADISAAVRQFNEAVGEWSWFEFVWLSTILAAGGIGIPFYFGQGAILFSGLMIVYSRASNEHKQELLQKIPQLRPLVQNKGQLGVTMLLVFLMLITMVSIIAALPPAAVLYLVIGAVYDARRRSIFVMKMAKVKQNTRQLYGWLIVFILITPLMLSGLGHRIF